MGLCKPWLELSARNDEGKFILTHNCNGNVSFRCTEELDKQTARWIELAIEEGKRRRSREFSALLGIG